MESATKVILYFVIWAGVFFLLFFGYLYIIRELKKYRNIFSICIQFILFLVISVIVLGPIFFAKKYDFYLHEMDGKSFFIFCLLYALAIFPSIFFWNARLNVRR